jgi:CRISPR/Cas system-associated endoribonuclease Cas2
MAIYVITYDLNKEPSSYDYAPLIENLEGHSCHKYQKSAWLGNFSDSAEVVYDHFRAFLDDNDFLFVAEITDNNKHVKNIKGTIQWLKDNPSTS